MIVKWMKSKVPISQRQAFSLAQEEWSRFYQVSGLLGRVGGWNLKDSNEASILTFWKDEQSYMDYREEWHEKWVKESGLDQIIPTVSSHMYTKKLDIPGRGDFPIFHFEDGTEHLIKIGDIRAQKEKVEQFMLLQQSVWNISMSHAPGMLTGMFAESTSDPQRFVVLTRWRSEREYEAYENHLLPKLSHWSYGNDMTQFQGRCIRLEQSWGVEAS